MRQKRGAVSCHHGRVIVVIAKRRRPTRGMASPIASHFHASQDIAETQNKLADLEERDQALERDLRNEIGQARTYAEQVAREQLQQREETQLEWRYAGLVLLFVGLLLSTTGNLVA